MDFTQAPEITDISGLQIGAMTSGDNNPPAIETPATPPADTSVVPAVDAPATPEPAAPVTPPVETPVSLIPPNTPTPEPVFDPSSEHFKSFLSKNLNGVESLEQVNQKIARLQELESNPAVLFKNDQERKIFDYLSKYPGGDYGKGFQNFIKLQELNVESLDSKSALRELYLMENSRAGLSADRAERMFEFEYQEKYESKGEIGKDFEDRDGFLAKQKLATLKQDAVLPPVVAQEDPARVKAIREREEYLSAIDQSFQKAPIKEIKFKVSNDPSEDYIYPVQDANSVRAAVTDVYGFMNSKYRDQKTGAYKMDEMKADFAFLQNKDDLFQKLIDHGINIGIERRIKERTNTPAPGTPPSNAPQVGALPQTMQESILAGLKK